MILNEKSKGILSKSVKLLYLFKDKGWVKCLIDLKKRFENIYIKKIKNKKCFFAVRGGTFGYFRTKK